MAKKTAKLTVVKNEQPPRRTSEDLKKEAKGWRITREEARARVHNLRMELENYRDQIDAVPFDILADSIPQSLDYSERRWAVDVMENFNPLIKGLFNRCDQEAKRYGADREIDFNGELFDLKLQLSETAFGVGILAGALFSGASPEAVERFERGLLYSVVMNPRIVR